MEIIRANLSREYDHIPLVLKDLATQETRLSISSDLQTIGDLRTYASSTRLIPIHMVRLVHKGQSYNTPDCDGTLLPGLLDGDNDTPRDQIIW